MKVKMELRTWSQVIVLGIWSLDMKMWGISFLLNICSPYVNIILEYQLIINIISSTIYHIYQIIALFMAFLSDIMVNLN